MCNYFTVTTWIHNNDINIPLPANEDTLLTAIINGHPFWIRIEQFGYACSFQYKKRTLLHKCAKKPSLISFTVPIYIKLAVMDSTYSFRITEINLV